MNTENYLEKFIKLENVVRDTYNLREADSISYYLSHEEKYKKFREDIKYYQDVRNWLHHNKKVNGSFAIEPNDAMIDFIDLLIEKITNRPKCSDICVKKDKIYWQGMDGNVRESIQKMRMNCFTHIPIMDGGKVIGIFDENSIFNYLASEEIVMIDSSLRFADMKEFISMNNREMERFIFLSYYSYVDELSGIIEDNHKNGYRVGMALLTMDGKEASPLMGIVTPWDIIQRK